MASHREGPAWRAAADYGCDMALIAANIERSVAERLHRHARALQTVRRLQKAMKNRV